MAKVKQGIGTIDKHKDIDYRPSDASEGEEWPQCISIDRMAAFIQKTYLVETSLQAWPFRCHPLWLTCFQGKAIVLVLPASIVAGQNDLEDFFHTVFLESIFLSCSRYYATNIAEI